MPATPSNILNTNLALGGDLGVTGNTSMTGNLAVAGDEIITGTVTTTGVIASGSAIAVITPTLGTFALDYTEVAFNVNTGSATTVINLGAGGLPANVGVVGVTMRVITAITGAGFDSTDAVLSLNPGTTPVVCGSLGATPYPAGTTDARIFGSYDGGVPANPPPIFPILIDDPDTAELVFSGGTSDIPSTGGRVRLTIYFFRVSAPTS